MAYNGKLNIVPIAKGKVTGDLGSCVQAMSLNGLSSATFCMHLEPQLIAVCTFAFSG